MENEMIKYYLVIEKRIGDFNIIDINKLDICDRYYLNDISEIDLFTSRFNEEEIIASIKRGNLVKEDYLDGSLKVISDKHHHLPVLTKDKYDLIREFQNNKDIISQDFKNKLYGAYKKIADKEFKDEEFRNTVLNKFNETLKSNDKYKLFTYLERLPYSNIRNFYFTIYKELNK